MHKLIVTMPLGEQIFHTSVFKGCEILVKGVVLKAILILLEMYDFYVILGMDWLSTHRALMDSFIKKIVFRKSRYLKLKFESDQRVLPTCVILALEAKRLPHKGCEAHLAHVVDKSSSEITLDSVPIVREFPDVFPKKFTGLHQTESWNSELNYCWD